MKKLVVAVIMLMVSGMVSGCAGSFEGHMLGAMGLTSFQNEPDGFRGIKWGTTIKELPKFEFIRNGTQQLTFYRNPEDIYEIGAAKLDKIEYCFFKNRLHSVKIITATGQDNWVNLRKSVIEKYNSGFSSNVLADNYYSWAGTTTFINLRNLYIYGELEMISRQAAEELGTYQKEMAQKGADKDF